MIDHDRIWLQPECCADETYGRLWCDNADPEPCEDGVLWSEYISADAYKALNIHFKALERTAETQSKEIAGLREEITSLKKTNRGLKKIIQDIGGRL
jgi:hypothetical protein